MQKIFFKKKVTYVNNYFKGLNPIVAVGAAPEGSTATVGTMPKLAVVPTANGKNNFK